MAENGISREEHEEFRRRMEDEHKRINHRIAEFQNVHKIPYGTES